MQTNQFDTPTRQQVIQHFGGSRIVASPSKAQGLVKESQADFVEQSCSSSDSYKTANQDEYKSPDESKMRKLQIKTVEQYTFEHFKNQNETATAINLKVQKVSGPPSHESAQKQQNEPDERASETHFEGQAPYKLDQFKAVGHIDREAGQPESDLMSNSESDQGLDRKQLSQQNISEEISSQDMNTGRGKRRSCSKKIPNYSNLHKGVPAGSALKEVNSSDEKVREQSPLRQQLSYQNSPEQKDELTNAEELVGQIIKLRSFEEICAVFDNLASFDWDLKDIKNLKHSPDKELTQVVYWFWINSQYFPYDAQIQAKKDFQSIFQTKVLNNIKKSPSLVSSDADLQCDQDPQEIEKLYVEDKFIQFRDLLIGTAMTNPQFTSIDDYIADLQGNLQKQEAKNYEQLQQKLQKFQSAYSNIPNEPDQEPYSAKNMLNYDHDFIEKIEYRYVEDIQQNLEWYLQNSSEILLNVNYPSRTEKEFLRQLEMWQQQKNDINYTLILQQLQQSEEKQTNLTEDIRYGQLSAHKRGLVVQEDAQCAICNNGDYEDEDLIVFCGICNIPVHQKCYGIDEIPDTDWICNNCSCFAMKRGLQVKCLLCPKRGGAMKPTSLFTSQDHYQRYYTAAAKKKGLSSTTFLTMNHTQSEPNELDPANHASKQQTFEREDKNHALSQILNRECNFQDALISQKRLNGENFAQDLIDLHFLQSEMLTEIPEDYIFFLQRNQKVLESGLVLQTETLYEWVHLSCAIWTPGPIVTPKTPVRMSKIDQKRFSLQCIICGKKNDGACVQCQHSKCMISFHIECARRANYFMEIEKGTDREHCFRIFCEKHRPFKIVKELEERDRQTVEEVYKFAKVINKCTEISQRAEEKYLRIKKFSPFTKQAQCQKKKVHAVVKPVETKKKEKLNLAKEKQLQRIQMLEEKKSQKLKRDFEKGERERQRLIQRVTTKRWKEKDKKTLFEQVKTKYLQLMKLRMNLVMIDPLQKQKKKLEKDKKRVQTLAQLETKKRDQKLLHKDSTRDGLRTRPNQAQQELHQTEMLLFEEADPSEIEGETAFYKWCNPVYLQELDWCITHSKYEFCWQDIAFKEFTAKDCYEKYVSSVRDLHSFVKKVLSGGGAMREKHKKLLAKYLDQSARSFPPETEENEEADLKVYCVCRGSVTSSFFVNCDGGDECPYGSWLHPECTDSLAFMTKEAIDDLGPWYCPACQIRIKEEELQGPEEDPQDEEDLAQIEQELLACAQEAEKIQQDLDNAESEQDSNELMSRDVSLSDDLGNESD